MIKKIIYFQEEIQCVKYELKVIESGEHCLTLGECHDIKKDSQKEYDLLLSNYRKESRTSFNVVMNVIIETITKNKKIDIKKIKPFYQGHEKLYEKYLEDGERLKKALIVNQSNKRWSLDKDVCLFMHKGNFRKCDVFFQQIETLFDKYHKYYEEQLKKVYLENILWFEDIILKIKK